ncbi:exosortase-associated protein EpsI, B-type [Methylotenera sp.]|uniref:exosortase-associated protein EpsI, B-type n=1 Tax=Methylotenera sp. TaxID=2051956 RepID=UPI00248A1A34|nr:exosortase-associated protein EpsI, B-type [Methylotenera sp.]MDI1298237.1 EpsI family protein [Methylotenera sp.]
MMKINMFVFPQITQRKSLLVAALLIIAALFAIKLTPTLHAVDTTPDLDKIIPTAFGEWKQIADPFTQVSLTTGGNDLASQLYDKIVMRTYANRNGDRVMLAIAYAREQKQDIKIHRPEVCYVAQGFQLLSKKNNTINMQDAKPIKAQRLLVSNQNRYETVSYWIRIGDDYPASGMAARLKILRDGLKGRVLDGVLVRVSTAISDPANAEATYKKQEAFLVELVNFTNAKIPSVLVAK